MVNKCQTKGSQTDLVAVFIITIISIPGISILNYFPNSTGQAFNESKNGKFGLVQN